MVSGLDFCVMASFNQQILAVLITLQEDILLFVTSAEKSSHASCPLLPYIVKARHLLH
jgi:hypothetical protein